MDQLAGQKMLGVSGGIAAYQSADRNRNPRSNESDAFSIDPSLVSTESLIDFCWFF